MEGYEGGARRILTGKGYIWGLLAVFYILRWVMVKKYIYICKILIHTRYIHTEKVIEHYIKGECILLYVC